MDRSIIDRVNSLTNVLSPVERKCLRIEEELLNMLIEHPDISLKVKREAMERISVINSRQAALFGHVLDKEIKIDTTWNRGKKAA